MGIREKHLAKVREEGTLSSGVPFTARAMTVFDLVDIVGSIPSFNLEAVTGGKLTKDRIEWMKKIVCCATVYPKIVADGPDPEGDDWLRFEELNTGDVMVLVDVISRLSGLTGEDVETARRSLPGESEQGAELRSAVETVRRETASAPSV